MLVYAGGDDVLAFLPVDQCMEMSTGGCMTRSPSSLQPFGSVTLSVGLAIAHFMENLEDLLAYGREAEAAAKRPDRNGLAVQLHKRGGTPGLRARAMERAA